MRYLATLGFAALILLTACRDDAAEKEESFIRGYGDGYELGSRTAEQDGYREGYAEGFDDGDLDVFSIFALIREAERSPSQYVRGATTPWLVLSWCDVTDHCEKQFNAERALLYQTESIVAQDYISIADVDPTDFDNEEEAYQGGFDRGKADADNEWRSIGWADGYLDSYDDATCSSGLPQKFGLVCSE